eukprot:scaffold562487_cov19-Prasinocladus_malaysianus.AAC.1
MSTLFHSVIHHSPVVTTTRVRAGRLAYNAVLNTGHAFSWPDKIRRHSARTNFAYCHTIQTSHVLIKITNRKEIEQFFTLSSKLTLWFELLSIPPAQTKKHQEGMFGK